MYELIKKIEKIGDESFELTCIRDFEEAVDRLFAEMGDKCSEGEFERCCPYFGVLWPAGKYLAAYLTRLPATLFQGKTFLELGCGLALPSLVAARRGAFVTASDWHSEVAGFLQQNLRNNQIEGLHYAEIAWQDEAGLPDLYDLIVAGDVLYDRSHPALLARFIQRHLNTNGVFVICDPGRPLFPDFLLELQNLGFSYHEEHFAVADAGNQRVDEPPRGRLVHNLLIPSPTGEC